MIRGFRCKDTQALFEGGDPRRFRAIKDAAIRKLSQLDAAHTLEFLRSSPGNQLEALKHDRNGQQYSYQSAMARVFHMNGQQTAKR
ncbi:MAG: type II toxin-antitoxin system RelE/ParE family toxin [Rhodanobacter sp.]